MGVYGKGEDCFFLEKQATATSGTDPLVSHPLNAMQGFDITGLQLVVDPDAREIVVTDTDNVVAMTGTWTFANGNFTAGDVGATFTVAGATAGGDNGTFTILTVVNGTTVTTATTGIVDETFDPDAVTVSLTRILLIGAWTIEVSNDTTPAGMAGSYDQDSDVDGHWSDITTAFSPSIPAVTGGADDPSRSWFAQATICVRAMRFTFTPDGGNTGFGFPMVIGLARSYS